MLKKLGHLRDLIDLTSSGISNRPNDANFFDKVMIVEIWQHFDPDFSLEEEDSVQTPMDLEQKNIGKTQQKMTENFAVAEVLGLFETLLVAAKELVV